MEIIAELEPTARGPYCGSLGWVGFDGAMDTNILIRTFAAGRGGCSSRSAAGSWPTATRPASTRRRSIRPPGCSALWSRDDPGGLVTTTDADGGPRTSRRWGREWHPTSPGSPCGRSRRRTRTGTSSATLKACCTSPDALLLAKAAIGAVGTMPPTRPADQVRGFVLEDCCRYFESW
jgi:hypothetical protein